MLFGQTPGLHIANLSQARQPDRVIVFGSAHYNDGQSPQEGFYEILAPNFAPKNPRPALGGGV